MTSYSTDDLCICDECGAELLARPQFDLTVQFADIEDDDLVTL